MTEGWRDRVVVERAQLDVRVDALNVFMDSNEYEELDTASSAFLLMQLHGMSLYLTALDARLEMTG